MVRTAACVWRIAPELVAALDERLGPPLDSYVNGTQTWLTDDGPGDITLEWRLHPVAGYRPPAGLSHYDVWEAVTGALAAGARADALPLGRERRPLVSLWEGLECFPAYDDLEPVPLSRAATEALGLSPAKAGLVDHDRIGAAWERERGAVSLVGLLLDELDDTGTDAGNGEG
jgi:hypothetical protein